MIAKNRALDMALAPIILDMEARIAFYRTRRVSIGASVFIDQVKGDSLVFQLLHRGRCHHHAMVSSSVKTVSLVSAQSLPEMSQPIGGYWQPGTPLAHLGRTHRHANQGTRYPPGLVRHKQSPFRPPKIKVGALFGISELAACPISR